MSTSRAHKKPSNVEDKEKAMVVRKDIPVRYTDLPLFDHAYAFMKERFAAEMKKIDEQMTKFGTELMQFYGNTTTVNTSMVPSKQDTATYNWDELTKSPLVEGEGNDKTLKLQFDVSQFHPDEVKLKLADNVLLVSATHEENSNGSTIYREYNREFMLPPGTDAEHVVPALSREGVLTVVVPLPLPATKELKLETQK